MTTTTTKTRSGGCGGRTCFGCGCVGIILFILAVTVLPIAYFTVYGEDTWFVPGDAKNFDPVASFAEVQTFAGENTRLVEIEAYYVRSDGTMNLDADYKPRVTYTFFRRLEAPPKDAPPVGAGGSAEDVWYEEITVKLSDPWQMFSVNKTGGGVNSSYQYINLGMDRDVDDPDNKPPGEEISAPACSFKNLWDMAIEEGANDQAVAIISYDNEGYEFDITDTDIRLKFDEDCALVES